MPAPIVPAPEHADDLRGATRPAGSAGPTSLSVTVGSRRHEAR